MQGAKRIAPPPPWTQEFIWGSDLFRILEQDVRKKLGGPFPRFDTSRYPVVRTQEKWYILVQSP